MTTRREERKPQGKHPRRDERVGERHDEGGPRAPSGPQAPLPRRRHTR